jgi:hypothetical protein
MFKLAAYAEIKRLLEEAEALEERLLPNELEMVRSLRVKYTDSISPDTFDMTSIEVIHRNVAVRAGFKFNAAKDGGRVVEFARDTDAKDD